MLHLVYTVYPAAAQEYDIPVLLGQHCCPLGSPLRTGYAIETVARAVRPSTVDLLVCLTLWDPEGGDSPPEMGALWIRPGPITYTDLWSSLGALESDLWAHWLPWVGRKVRRLSV